LIAREPNDVPGKYGSVESEAEELIALTDQTTIGDADVRRG